MKRIVLILAMLFGAFSIAWGQQWEIFAAIAQLKSIDIDFDDEVYLSSYNSAKAYNRWRASNYCSSCKLGSPHFTINGDYTVSLSYGTKMYSQTDSNYGRVCPVELWLTGSGIIVWESDKMLMKLNVTEKVIGGKYDFTNQSTFKHEDYQYNSSSKTKTYVYEVEMGYDKDNDFAILLKGDDIVSITSGTLTIDWEKSQSWYYGAYLNITNKALKVSMKEKSQSELNSQNSDVYGKWQWNSDRSKIYLSSTSNDSHLILWNNNDTLSWGFSLPDKATGYKTDTADSGENLEYLMITFDGSSEQSFSFINDGNNFTYAQYDRFMGTLKRDASILNQIKDKRILIVNYKLDGSDKTAMFQLEGLEAIYNAITQ